MGGERETERVWHQLYLRLYFKWTTHSLHMYVRTCTLVLFIACICTTIQSLLHVCVCVYVHVRTCMCMYIHICMCMCPLPNPQALLKEVSSYEASIQAVDKEGQELVDADHFASDDISLQQLQLQKQWRELKLLAGRRTQKLSDALEAQKVCKPASVLRYVRT